MYLGKFLLTDLPRRSRAGAQHGTDLSNFLFYVKCLICKSLWVQQFAPKGLETAGGWWDRSVVGRVLADPGLLTVQERSPGWGNLGACDFWQQQDGCALPSGRLWRHLRAAPQAVEMPEPGSPLQLSSILGGFKTD